MIGIGVSLKPDFSKRSNYQVIDLFAYTIQTWKNAPDQINIYQAVRAETARVRDLLQMIYVDKNPIPGMKPINADIQDKLDTIAQEIVDAILPPAKESFHQVLEPWLVLNAPTAAAFKTEDDLDGASIEDLVTTRITYLTVPVNRRRSSRRVPVYQRG